MSDSDTLPARFTISDVAKLEIEHIRELYDEKWPDNPAEVASIAWAQWRPHVGEPWWGVIVGFYCRSERHRIAHGIQHVSGLPIVFFTTAEHAPRFDGKVLDFMPERSFFLRDP